MNTVPDLQPEDRAQLLVNNVERQKLRARQQEIQARLEELDQQDNEILTKTARTEHEESESMFNFSWFEYKTQELLKELRDTRKGVLSKDDILEFVIEKENATDKAVRTLISRARKEMKCFPECCYEIETVRGEGYRLVRRETLPNVTKPTRTRKKQRK